MLPGFPINGGPDCLCDPIRNDCLRQLQGLLTEVNGEPTKLSWRVYPVATKAQLEAELTKLRAELKEVRNSQTPSKDADADTKIQVEETADEDKIRFDVAGTEKWVMTGSRVESKNTGNSVFIGEGAGANDNLSTNENTFIGSQSGASNTDGQGNVATGRISLFTNIDGDYNVAIGTGSLYFNDSGNNNVATGYASLFRNTTGNANVATGRQSLWNNTTGNNNIAMGVNAGDLISIGSNNTFLGSNSDANANNLTNATAIGANAIVTSDSTIQLGDNTNIEFDRALMPGGNAGTAKIAKNININPIDFEAVKNTVLDNDINMVLVGPEAPLVHGVHDFFLADDDLKNIPVIGPKKDGALLEGSKDFSKQFMEKHGIPTAKYKSFTKETLEQGFTFLETLAPPYVLKADGLAAGKGVLILNDLDEAKAELKEMLSNQKFGEASSTVVIEEFLKGIELSVFVLTDGKNYKILPSAKDYKRIGEGDTGLNTGGMGAISPVPFADKDFLNKVEELVIKPTISGLQKDGIDYRGFIFIGLMNDNGNPSVVEYNVRMGDPETEVVLPRITSDLYDLFDGVANQTLDQKSFSVTDQTATTVMLVSGGYPEAYKKGKEISGIENVEDSIVFHAGTTSKNDKIITNGGRVLAVTSFGNTIEEALKKSYASIDKISFENMNYRRDIGFDLV